MELAKDLFLKSLTCVGLLYHFFLLRFEKYGELTPDTHDYSGDLSLRTATFSSGSPGPLNDESIGQQFRVFPSQYPPLQPHCHTNVPEITVFHHTS